MIEALDPPLRRCGGLLPLDDAERAVAELETRAARNEVAVQRQADGSLLVPGEMVTDPVMYALFFRLPQGMPARA